MNNNQQPFNHRNMGEANTAIDGTVGIIDNRIVVKNPEGSGIAAKILPGQGIRLIINDREVKDNTVVMENLSILIEILDKKPGREFQIFSDDGDTAASIKVSYNDGQKYILKDKAPQNELLLQGIPENKIECLHFTMEEALELLKSKGIICGIIEDNLKAAIETDIGKSVLIARMQSPVDAADDIIHIKYETEVKEKFVEVKDRVDYYSIGKIISVNPGDLLVEKTPGSDGSPGFYINGKEIKQKKGKRIHLLAGKGAVISEDGLRAYSNILGRPEIINNTVSVHEVYIVPYDVDISTGNIEFAGDVTVRGNVTDGMKVNAGGNVVVSGGITNGKIIAGGDVIVNKNIIGSEIKAGCFAFVRLKLMDFFINIKKGLMEVFYAVDTLKETGKIPKSYKDGQIIKLLMDTKFNSLNHTIMELRGLLSDNRDYADTESVVMGAKLIKFFTGNGPLLINNYKEITAFDAELKNHMEEQENHPEKPSKIEANYIQNSTLSTNGSIHIFGRGCYNSNLYCKCNVIFERPNSVMRGGNIDAGCSVKIYELGSPGGAFTTVAAGKDSTIISEIAHVNSTIKVGGMSSMIDTPSKKLKAYIYKGELMIEKSKA